MSPTLYPIWRIEVEKFDTSPVYDDVRAIHETGAQPFLVHKCGDLAALVGQGICASQLDIFKIRFQTTKQAKTKGRAQRTVGDKGDDLRKLMLLAAPFADLFLPTDCINCGLRWNETVMHFGFTKEMQYHGSEYDSMPQLRYMVYGKIDVRCAPCQAVERFFRTTEGESISMAVAEDKFKDMTENQLDEMKELCLVKTFTQKAGQMSYMPAGWIVVNKTSGGELVVGLRTTAVASDRLDEFKTYIENSHKHGLGDG